MTRDGWVVPNKKMRLRCVVTTTTTSPFSFLPRKLFSKDEEFRKRKRQMERQRYSNKHHKQNKTIQKEVETKTNKTWNHGNQKQNKKQHKKKICKHHHLREHLRSKTQHDNHALPVFVSTSISCLHIHTQTGSWAMFTHMHFFFSSVSHAVIFLL